MILFSFFLGVFAKNSTNLISDSTNDSNELSTYYYEYYSTTDNNSTNQREFDPELFYNEYLIKYLDNSELQYLDEIGSGSFSKVYKGMMPDGSLVAIKRLIPTSEWRIKKEIQILEKLAECPHILPLKGIYGDEFHPEIVTEYMEGEKNAIPTYQDMKWLMKSLFKALNATHYNDIFHRDIKWQNLIVSFKDHKMLVIDWGLAETLVKCRPYSPKTGTKSYKAPELLLSYKYYNEKVDIWAAGCIMANLMFGMPSFFNGHDNEDVLYRHVKFYGKLRMKRLAERYGKKIKLPQFNRESFIEYALPHTRHLITQESFEFLSSLLVPEPEFRPDAAIALASPFFDNITYS